MAETLEKIKVNALSTNETDSLENLNEVVPGEVSLDSVQNAKYKRDTSIFEIQPAAVISPRNVRDIQNVVNFVNKNKKKQPNLSITARSAGTDMAGGPLTDSILLEFMSHFNQIKEIKDHSAIIEPGVYYRDFEKEAAKYGLLYPSYPASKDLCAFGGIVNNNSGGEKTLVYGKTNKYIEKFKMVLSDGNIYTLKKVGGKALEEKLKQKDFEGEIYRKIHKLLSSHEDVIAKSRPQVSKNSSGYNIWDAWDGENLDLTQLVCGAQGTLGIVTEAKVRLVPIPKHEKLYVIFMKNMKNLPQFVQDVLALKPTSFEITDDHTFKIYLRYAREMAAVIGSHGLFETIKLFMPETMLILRHGMPKLIVLVEFEGNDPAELRGDMKALDGIVKKYKMIGHRTKNRMEANKYWKLRRDTFKLLREKITDRHSTPFVDDIIVKPQDLPEFWPQLTSILDNSKLFYTISGHLGDGNLHIIPLMDLSKETEREKIYPTTDKVYDLVLKYHGSITAEHNDGLMRAPYLKEEFGEEVYKIFEEVKKAFDPDNIFNPHKKTDGTFEYAKAHMIKD